MSLEELHEMLKQGETKTLDFVSKMDDEEALGRSVCAFLNSDGGRVVVGVDAEGVFHAERLPPAEAKTRVVKILNQIITPKAYWSVSAETFTEGTIIIIDVPPGIEKPYTSHGGIFVRRGNQAVSATSADIGKLLIKRSSADVRWERQPVPGVELSDLDKEEILKTAHIAETSGRHTFQDRTDVKAVLEALSLSAEGQFTNAAVVLFGREAARFYPQTRVRATIYKSDKSGSEFLKDQMFDGHMFYLLDRVTDFLQKSVEVSSEFTPLEWQRTDKPNYPFWALREGVVNAMIHRDFASNSGGMTIGVYPHQIKIWNYGKIPTQLTPADLKKLHPSLPPNPDIARVFFLRGLIEQLGRGTQKIVSECKEAGLKVPVWETGPSGTTLTFFGRRKRPVGEAQLSERQQRVITFFAPGEEFTLIDYVNKVAGSISERTARTDLSGLLDAGLIIRRGKGKNTKYVRTPNGV